MTIFTQQTVEAAFELQIDADFADITETKGTRRQRGTVRRQWRPAGASHELTFTYTAEQTYDHQGHAGTAQLQRGVTLRFSKLTSAPQPRGRSIQFTFELSPHGTWHLCVDVIPHIDGHLLPSLYRCRSFHRDEDHPFPAHYPDANSPQAWSASSTWCLLQSILALYPYAPLNLLLVDPLLPEWLPEIVVRNLHVGAAVIDLRFYRTKTGDSDYEVPDKRGPLHVIRQPSPWSLTATYAERLQDALTSLLPGK